MEVDAGLAELVDERFAAIKRQHFPSYLGLLRSWRESLKRTEEWMVKKEQEFIQFADTVISQYQKGPAALQDHNYFRYEDEHAFVAHNCSEGCWAMGMVVKSPSKFSSLSLPLLLGWQRVFMMRPVSEGNRTDTYYCAPCGRRLRSMEEVNRFLEMTCAFVAECNIFITNFTFDPLCSLVCPPYNAKSAGAKVFIPDITCDAEAIPITCVNSITSDPPEHFHYISHREIGPGVHIETDPGFLVSCSCTDHCANRSTCECWLLTMQEAQTINSSKQSVGYRHGRLKKPQHSAIYECNPHCSCGPRCGNRVVQRGVEHHLQVFRTEDRGWGLRTLRDIPAGSFICTYVGQVFPEHTLENQEGQHPTPISDEYFAELDYIEVMEHHKEGYEEDVVMPSDHDSTSGSEDESFTLDSITSSNTREGGLEASSCLVSDEDGNSDSSSSLSFMSLCSSTVISPIHSPSALPPSEPHAATNETHPATNEPHLATNEPPIATNEPHLATTKPHQATDKPPPATNEPHLATNESHPATNEPRPTTLPSVQAHVTTATSQTVVTTPTALSGSSNPRIGQSYISPGSKTRPAHALPTTPTALSSSNRPSHLPNEQRIRSPLDYVVPISPHRQYGMRTRQHFREDFSYIIDAKDRGNIGRYINHSCSPNMFVQNVFVDTHDLRFPWVAFFARNRIKALQELTWDYSYEVGSVEGKVIYCRCKAPNCRGRLL